MDITLKEVYRAAYNWNVARPQNTSPSQMDCLYKLLYNTLTTAFAHGCTKKQCDAMWNLARADAEVERNDK